MPLRNLTARSAFGCRPPAAQRVPSCQISALRPRAPASRLLPGSVAVCFCVTRAARTLYGYPTRRADCDGPSTAAQHGGETATNRPNRPNLPTHPLTHPKIQTFGLFNRFRQTYSHRRTFHTPHFPHHGTHRKHTLQNNPNLEIFFRC